MALKRMDNIGIVVDDLGRTIDFFRELGLELEGRATIEGENRTRNETSSSLRTESERSIEGSWPQSSLNCSGCRRRDSRLGFSCVACRHKWILIGLFTLLSLTACRRQKTSEQADLVVRNAKVYTADSQRPWADAVAIKGDRIAWVGDDSGAGAKIGPSTRVIDAGGKMLLPGFIDSHFHVLLGGNSDVLRIQNAGSLKQIQEQVRDFATKRPKLNWIEVEGWNYSAFPHGILPTAKDLEGLTAGRPAFLVAYDYHTIWMNREALKEFSITRKTTNVIFAEKVEKDAHGEPTGVVTGFGSTGLSEDAEAELRKHLPSHGPGQVERGIQWNMRQAVKAGIHHHR